MSHPIFGRRQPYQTADQQKRSFQAERYDRGEGGVHDPETGRCRYETGEGNVSRCKCGHGKHSFCHGGI